MVWWVITEARPGTLWVGVVAVALATLASLALAPGRFGRLRPLALLAFVPYFLLQSVRGGSDVVRRAFSPRLPLDPAIRTYSVAAMGATERVTFAVVASLLPGTLSCWLEGDRLVFHALDDGMPNAAAFAALEARLAPVFGRSP